MKPMKLVRTDLLTGQEKYENEKERRDVEKMAEGARQEAAAIRKEIDRQQGEIDNHYAIAKSFNDHAKADAGLRKAIAGTLDTRPRHVVERSP